MEKVFIFFLLPLPTFQNYSLKQEHFHPSAKQDPNIPPNYFSLDDEGV